MAQSENEQVAAALGIILPALQQAHVAPGIAAVAGLTMAVIVHKSCGERLTRDRFMELCASVYDTLCVAEQPFPGARPTPIVRASGQRDRN